MSPRDLTNLVKEELLGLDGCAMSCNLTSGPINMCTLRSSVLKEHAESISIGELNNEDIEKEIDLQKNVDIHCHIFRLDVCGPQAEMMENGGEEGLLSAANHWILPSKDFSGLWESLIYDSSIKSNLLSFVETTLLFSDKCVDANVISWNRVVLLHGPPGTGKTSLCKALAQKLSIRLGQRYTHGELVEINSHSLFSKWFSESGKLVMKMFSKIHELIDDPQALVCVLIDEVESLTHARQSSMSGTEPSDSIRVVNAVLTQIDQIRRYPNVLILTTSNLTSAIDIAFVDRADIKQYIGLPSKEAIYQIYYSCIVELQTRCVITRCSKLRNLNSLPSNSMEMLGKTGKGTSKDDPSGMLMIIAEKSVGLSGRTLRKIPFLAHAHFVQKPTCSLENFLIAMDKAVVKQFEDQDAINKK